MHARKLASGTILRGEYVLLGVIGEAGSSVFRAHHRRDDRLVAVRIQAIDPPNAFPRALDVPNVAARVRDPLLASVEACGRIKEGFLFVVSEYVSGQRMDQWADKVGIPPLATVIELVQGLSRALARAHREGIAHGAINPGNLVILRSDSGSSPGFTTKLLDLGVPAAMRPRPPRLRSSYFMAPEQLAAFLRSDGGASTESDSRMDVYGCGALLYHLCTGGPPFQGRSIGELIAAHTAGKLLLPSRINPRIPAALEAIILRALAHDPLERHASAGELADALGEIRHTSGISSVFRRSEAPRARESPVELSEIFSGFELDERPTSEIPILEVASNADTARPPAPEAAAVEQEVASSAQLAPISRPPAVVSPAMATPPPVPTSLRPAVAPPMMPPAPAARPPATPPPALRPSSGHPFVPPPPAIPAEARRERAPSGVPAGSFSSAPPARRSQRSTQRLSDPFAPQPQPPPVEQPLLAVPTHASLHDALEQPPEDEKAAPSPAYARLLSFTRLHRRWLGLALASAVLLVAYLSVRPPATADGRGSALAPEEGNAVDQPLRPPQPQAFNEPTPRPPTPHADSIDTARALPKVEARAEPRARAKVTSSLARTPTPRSAQRAAKAPVSLQSFQRHVPEEPPAPEPRQSAPAALHEPSFEPGARPAATAPSEPGARTAEPAAEAPSRTTDKSEPETSPPVLAVKRIEAARPQPLAATTAIRDLTVRGSLATSDVRRAIERVRAQFSQCYETLARAAGRNAFGEIAVQVAIDESGRAGKANATGSTLPGLGACIAQATDRMVSTKRPDTGTVKATFTLTFLRTVP